MASAFHKRIKKLHKKNNELIGIIILIVIGIGFVIAIFASQNTIEEKSQAFEFQDLNVSSNNMHANNPDGTMGPADATGNFSNTLLPAQQGTLTFFVTDPSDGMSLHMNPTGVIEPTHQFPPRGQGDDNHTLFVSGTPMPSRSEGNDTHRGGQQAVSSLIFTITKAEVHPAYQGTRRIESRLETASPSPAPSTQPTDHWETINIGSPKTIDLAQLTNGNLSVLGVTNLAAGLYNEIRLYITDPSATLPDGTKVNLIIPGKANVVRIVRPFTIVAGQNTSVTVDFDAQHSVIKAGSSYILKPVIGHVVEEHKRPFNGSPTPTNTFSLSITPRPTKEPEPTHPLLSITPPITPPEGCFYKACTIACSFDHPNCCPPILVCATGTPTCLSRPSCLDATPKCDLPEPAGGWCPVSNQPLTQVQSNSILFFLNNFLRMLRGQ